MINADPQVMQFFPAVQTIAQTAAFIQRMQTKMEEKGYCYFAADLLHTGKAGNGNRFIGFIGLSDQVFDAAFTPCTDIGWRLSKEAWGHGYATEGAARCLQYGLNELGLQEVYAMAPSVNIRSIQVMKNIGMSKVSEFIHPLLADDVRLRDCVLYMAKG